MLLAYLPSPHEALVALAVLATLAFTNRYAGEDMPFNKEVFGLSVALSCALLGYPHVACIFSGVLAYFARQVIGHGAVYRLDRNARQRSPWWSISFTRAALMFAPLGSSFVVAAALAAFGCLFSNILGRKLEDRGIVSDMLKVAEPLQGLSYGIALVLLTKFGGIL